MNRIVHEQYPASRLPADLREGLASHEAVRVTIDAPAPDSPPSEQSALPKPGFFSQFRHLRHVNFASDADVDAYLRVLRDEPSDRTR